MPYQYQHQHQHQYQRPQWTHLSRPTTHSRWRKTAPTEPLGLLPGLTFYFPPRQMERMRAAYTRARTANPGAYPTFQYFVLARVAWGLAERCLSFAPGVGRQDPQLAGQFLAAQLQEAARQLGIDQRTLLYWLVVPEDARREQRWQAMRSVVARSMSARWGRRGCSSSLVGLAVMGLLLCGLLGFAEAIAAFLVHAPH